MSRLSVEDRLERLEHTVATLASWLVLKLGREHALTIIDMLHEPPARPVQSADGREREVVA